MINVTAGDVTDRQAATDMLPALRTRFPTITKLGADGGYTGTLITWALQVLQLVVTVIKRSDDVSGFVVLPRRWVVERTLCATRRSVCIPGSATGVGVGTGTGTGVTLSAAGAAASSTAAARPTPARTSARTSRAVTNRSHCNSAACNRASTRSASSRTTSTC
ncbi:transposase [Streptomyces sp. V1I1]|nr:transposase [Streptomyces sp. V1I1]